MDILEYAALLCIFFKRIHLVHSCLFNIFFI